MTSKKNEAEFFLARHMKSSKDSPEDTIPGYPSLSGKGVEQAKETVKNRILEMIKNSPEGSIVFIGGASDQVRTKSTAIIMGKELAALKDDLEQWGITVITKEDIDQIVVDDVGEEAVTTAVKEKAFMPGQIIKVVKKLQEMVANNPGKIVIDYPLMLKELAYKHRNRWTDQKGKNTEYFREILKKHNNDHTPAGLDWLENQGVLATEDGRKIQGPNPTEVAKDYLDGMERLRKFVSKYTDRPIVVGGVGHQWDLDAVVTYLASGRKDVTIENFRKFVETPEKLIGNSEMFTFSIGEEGVTVEYRGKKLSTKNDEQK